MLGQKTTWWVCSTKGASVPGRRRSYWIPQYIAFTSWPESAGSRLVRESKTIAVRGNRPPAYWSRRNQGGSRATKSSRSTTHSASPLLRRTTGASPTSLSSGSVLKVSYERLGWVWHGAGGPHYNSLHS